LATPSLHDPPSAVVVANCGSPAIHSSNLDSLQLCLKEMRSWRWKNNSLNQVMNKIILMRRNLEVKMRQTQMWMH